MSSFRVPIRHPQPDGQRFIHIIMGQERAERPPLVEYIVDPAVMKPIVTDLLGREWVIPGADRESQARYWDNFIAFWHRMGYDFVRFEMALAFPRSGLLGDDPTMAGGKRGWVDEHHGAIASWEDFERYPWPTLESVDFWSLEYITSHLPEGMGFITCHGAGIYEHWSQILSYEGLSLMLYDDPALARAVCDRIGELMLQYYRQLLDLPNLLAIFQGDDMGFRTATLIGPDPLREYCLPWQRRFAALTHERGRPYFLHSCGNLETIMEDLIADVGIDAKHSFEDAIIPVVEFQAKYGARIGVLGGVDLNVLAGQPPERVRDYVRGIINACGPRGRYAIGSGNSIPSYVPVENYLTMLDEALA